jgi:hypothetical protein
LRRTTESASHRLNDQQVDAIAAEVRPFTMVPDVALRFTIRETVDVLDRGVLGEVVECGVWRGGSALAMLLAQRQAFGEVVRLVHLLDSFEGLPPATGRDGPLALSWQRDTESPAYFDNCRAAKEEVVDALGQFGFGDGDYRIHPGWFSDTVPVLAGELRTTGVALLRLDGDWYESTRTCLEHLFPLVSPAGTVIFDDYYAWDGCALAVHEYLGEHGIAARIRSIPSFHGSYLRNAPARLSLDEL